MRFDLRVGGWGGRLGNNRVQRGGDGVGLPAALGDGQGGGQQQFVVPPPDYGGVVWLGGFVSRLVAGMLEGPGFELYGKILNQFPSLKLIASGGVSNIDDVNQLRNLGCHATIIGKAFYEGKILLSDLK